MRRRWAITLGLALVLTGLAVTVGLAQGSIPFLPGDMNDDGVFDIVDSVVLRQQLAGKSPGITQLCGNAVLDLGEDCELGTLNGADCLTQGFGGGALTCAPGCVFDTGACHPDCDPQSPQPFCAVNEHCLPQPSGGAICLGPTGGFPVGLACSTDDQCLPELSCIADPLAGTACRAWCRVAANDCVPGELCVPRAPAVFAQGQEFGACVPRDCDPLDPSVVCGPDSHCIPQAFSSGSGVPPLCLSPTGPGTQDTPCAGPEDCADIYQCVNPGFGGMRCMQWCRPGAGDCAAGVTCVSSSFSWIGTQEWGVCFPGA